MRPFRLARLLRLRDEESELAKQNWRIAERAARAATDAVTCASRELGTARLDLGRSFESGDGVIAAAGVLSAHEVIDALVARVNAATERALASREAANEKQAIYEEVQRRVKALRTLEERHQTEERRRLRRRDERALDEAIAARRLASGQASPETSTPKSHRGVGARR